jgi:hypothetical protein
VCCSDGTFARAAVPSGASTGTSFLYQQCLPCQLDASGQITRLFSQFSVLWLLVRLQISDLINILLLFMHCLNCNIPFHALQEYCCSFKDGAECNNMHLVWEYVVLWLLHVQFYALTFRFCLGFKALMMMMLLYFNHGSYSYCEVYLDLLLLV